MRRFSHNGAGVNKFAFASTCAAAAFTGLAYRHLVRDPIETDRKPVVAADSATSEPQKRYIIDPSQSRLDFNLKHLLYFDVHGSFSKFAGEFDIKSRTTGDRSAGHTVESLTWSSGPVEVDASSINTHNWLRDRRMRNDFLEVQKFPRFLFQGGRWVPLEDRPYQSYRAHGKVCIRDIWKDVELDVQIDPNTCDKDQVRAKIRGTLNRFDFDILTNWPEATVGKHIHLDFTIVAHAKQEAE